MDCGTVLVVDTDDEWRSEIGAMLAHAGYDALGAATAAEAFQLMERESPVLVVLDVALPDLDGYAVCRQLRERHGDALPIMLVSADRTEPHDRIAALLIGADDCLAKPLDAGELIARARRHLARARTNGNGMGDGHHHPHDEAVDGFGLTPRERQVLALLAAGYAQPAIARELVISSKTVASHITRILSKLGVHSRAQAVAVAHREALVADFEGHATIFAAAASS